MIELLFPVMGTMGSDARTLHSLVLLMQSVIPRSEISDGEKLLWSWLVMHCVQYKTDTCVISYQQLADIMLWKIDSIHRALLRLRLEGFIKCELPFLHGIVDMSAALAERVLSPTLPEHEAAIKRELEINLIRDRLRNENINKMYDNY